MSLIQRRGSPTSTDLRLSSPDPSWVAHELREAMRYQLSGQLAAAEQSLGQLVALAPDSADGWHLYGVLALQSGDFAQAVDRLQKAVRLNSEHADYHFNLAGAYYSLQRWGEAVGEYRLALRFNPQMAEAWKGLGAGELQLGQRRDAIQAWRQSLEVSPDQFDVFLNLADALEEDSQPEEAIETLRLAVRLDPQSPAAHERLAVLYLKLSDATNAACAYYNAGVTYQRRSDPERAGAAFLEALRWRPSHPQASYLLDCLRGRTPAKAPPEYVVELFDQYADRFDEHLALLKYEVPQLLRSATDKLNTLPGAVLDLGCGTGRCGVLFRDRATRLVGVDLAPKMIEAARQRRVYDEVHLSDVKDYLNDCVESFDVVLAADVFIYVGALEEVFARVARVSRPGAIFAFSMESWDEGEDFLLRPTGRFAHSRAYVDTLASKYGFRVESRERVTIREQEQKPILGDVVVLGRGK